MKKYSFEAIERDGKLWTKGICDGFTAEEVLYILVSKCNDIFEQMYGKKKPIIKYKRIVILEKKLKMTIPRKE